jgi:hypothetical protein
MAKHQKSNREAKKPKKTAAEKSKSPITALSNQIAGNRVLGTSYKDRFK